MSRNEGHSAILHWLILDMLGNGVKDGSLRLRDAHHVDKATYNRALVHVHVDIVFSPLSDCVQAPLSCIPMCCHYT